MATDALKPALSVPFLDLEPSHGGIKAALLSDIADLIDSGAFTNGPSVSAFEQAFAEYCGASLCVGTANGLDALRIALLAAGLEPGDEVIVPALTFIATVEAVTQAGGVPVLVDIDERDYGLDCDAVEAVMTERTRFVLPVHLYGQMADMRRLQEIAARRGVEIVEDACQAHGAERDGLRAGSCSLAAGFSFYPGKNLGAFGDAGALVTSDAALAARARALREHGQTAKYRHDYEGYTSRLDTIQALALLHKLPLVETWNAQRRKAAALYTEALRDAGDLRLPPVPLGSDPVWHLFVIRTSEPQRLAAFLHERGIASGRHYPQPVHLTGAYAGLGHRRGAFSHAESVAGGCLSLPIYPGISDAQVETVADAIHEFFARG